MSSLFAEVKRLLKASIRILLMKKTTDSGQKKIWRREGERKAENLEDGDNIALAIIESSESHTQVLKSRISRSESQGLAHCRHKSASA